MLRPLFARRPPAPGHAPSFPDWVLLDTVVRGANHDWEKISSKLHRSTTIGALEADWYQCSAALATTARTFMEVQDEGVEVEVEVSFFFVSPPQVSGFIVHVGDNGLSYGATVVITDGDAVLLHITVAMFNGLRYLVYKADHGSPSLEVLPHRPVRFHSTNEVGILSHGDGYVVAALARNLKVGPLAYELFLCSSTTKAWSSKVIPLDGATGDDDLRHVLNHQTTKVITVGVDSLGWVDLWRGILLCNVLDEDPVVRYPSFPRPTPGNSRHVGTSSSRPFTDVICVGDMLRFIEVEYHQDADSEDDDVRPTPPHDPKRTMERTLASDWNMCCSVETGDILLAGQSWDLVSHRVWDDDEQRLSLRKFEPNQLCSYSPTLGMDDDVFYMMARPLGSNDKPLGLFGALDMRNMDMRLVSLSTERMSYIDPNYCPRVVSRYFNDTSGKNTPGENLRWIGLVKLAVLQDILAAIQTVTSLDAKLKILERPDEEELRICSVSIAMLNQMADGITSYTDDVCATSIRCHVSALEEGFSLLRAKTLPATDKNQCKIVDTIRTNIASHLAHILVLYETINTLYKMVEPGEVALVPDLKPVMIIVFNIDRLFNAHFNRKVIS
ncbi:hypothetical protein VPH35_064840 [Triticum aestivum]